MHEDLKKLGLTDNEIKVYLSLLKIGETAVGGIINDLKIHRQIAYNALNSLEQKNMVSKTMKNRVHHYRANDPAIVVENIKQQELIAQRLVKTLQDTMKKSRHEHEINVYDGRTKIRNFFMARDRNLPRESVIRVITNYADKYEKVLGQDFLIKKYNELTIKKKHQFRIIIGESKRQEIEPITAKLGKLNVRKVRFLEDALISPMAIEVWDQGISFSSFEDDWFVIEVKNPAFIRSYRRYFDSLWPIAKN
jgi:sugar-specific transcriptional regulator TrmB